VNDHLNEKVISIIIEHLEAFNASFVFARDPKSLNVGPLEWN